MLQKFWNYFNWCWHDWETIELASNNKIRASLKQEQLCEYYGMTKFYYNRVCLKCHTKDFQIDNRKEHIKKQIQLENFRKNLAETILQKEKNANS